MNYFRVAPDVPFGLGDDAEFNQDPASWVDGVKPFVKIDLVLFELPIPDFTTTDAVYFASPALADALASFSGLRQRSYTLGFDPQMEELGQFAGKHIPELVCFEVTGKYGKSDFAHVQGVPDLLVSERALSALRKFDLGAAEVTPYKP